MDILQLKYFEKIVQVGSMTKAAAEIGVSESRLSKSIAKLENELGIKLFSRVGKRLNITDAGLVFLDSTKRILNEIGNCTRQLKYNSDFFSGRISICVIGAIVPACVTDTIVEYSSNHASVSFHINMYQPGVMTTQSLDGYDFVISDSQYLPSNYASISLPQTETLVLLPYTHRLAKRPFIDVEDLANENLIISQYVDIEDTDSTYSLFTMHNVTPNIKVLIEEEFPEFEDIFKHILITSSEEFVGLIPSTFRPLYKNNSNYVTIPLRTRLSSHSWNAQLAWNQAKPLSPIANEFMSFINVKVSMGANK